MAAGFQESDSDKLDSVIKIDPTEGQHSAKANRK